MDYIAILIICLTVCFGAGLTFFSGFGLGTIMLPVFSLFFPLHIAVAATAIVHLANNLFKFALVRKDIHKPTFLRFGLPALFSAVVGGYLLTIISDTKPIYSYVIFEKTMELTWMKIVIGFLMIFFAWFDLSKRFSNYSIDPKHIPLGGILSGFFGGISGHQGAFRAAFLSKSGLDKKQFIGTSNAVAVIIDVSRLMVYVFGLTAVLGGKQKGLVQAIESEAYLLGFAILFAFLGTFIGKRLVEKTTILGVQHLVGILLFIMGTLLIAGIL